MLSKAHNGDRGVKFRLVRPGLVVSRHLLDGIYVMVGRYLFSERSDL